MKSNSETVTLLAAICPGDEIRDLMVRWDPTPPRMSDEVAARIETVWANQLATAKAARHKLFDGTVTRLLQVSSTPTAVTVRLGPADYKSFLVTCLRDRSWFQAYAPEAAVEALGNSALVTRGSQTLLALRAPGVSAYPGRWHLIGGVLEALDTPGLPASRAGLEAHLRKELLEELGLSPPELRPAPWPRPLAVARDEFLGQPELVWQWDLRVPLETVLQNLDPDEHSDARILQKDDMTAEFFKELTPVARLAWKMWAAE